METNRSEEVYKTVEGLFKRTNNMGNVLLMSLGINPMFKSRCIYEGVPGGQMKDVLNGFEVSDISKNKYNCLATGTKEDLAGKLWSAAQIAGVADDWRLENTSIVERA
jgi:hypothetical protein